MANTIQIAGSFAAMVDGPHSRRPIDPRRITAFAYPARSAAKPVRKSARSRRVLERDANERLSIPSPVTSAGQPARPLSLPT